MTNTTNIFEVASRKKFRYPYKGYVTTEDLWDLNLDQLDSIFKTLNKENYERSRTSLMTTMDVNDAETLTKIEIVRHVFNVKEAEREARANAAAIAAKKRLIMDILEKKQNENLMNMSEDDLAKMLADMG